MQSIPYHEWRQEQLRKAPAAGGIQTPIAPFPNGSFPTSGHANVGPGRSALNPRAGTGAYSGNYSNLPSKYTSERSSQPPPYIQDVDESLNWYSPFQPIWPFGPPYINRPRDWDYPVGYNLNYIQPRMELMKMLRGMRKSLGVLATVIATRQDQLLRIPWTIQRRDRPRASSKVVSELQKFFRRPDGKHSYGAWTRLITDDLLLLDAPCIYFSRDRAGRPITAERLDPLTIFPLIDDAGRRPDSVVEVDEDGLTYVRRQPAFQQIIKGLPMLDLDESEVMYAPMRPNADFPIFGYSPAEQIMIEVTEEIRKTFYMLNFWQEGTIPDLIVTVPDSWSPRQIAMFQAHFDALLSGNVRLKSKVRFLPGGMKPFDIKGANGETIWTGRDEFIIRLVCYAYSVSPAPFIKMLNRSTAQNAQQMAEEEGLYPLMSYWKDDIIDPIIQDRFGYEDIEFVFLPRPEPDLEKQAKIHDLKIKSGEYSINEAREENGMEPIEGGDAHMIYIGNQVIPLEMAEAGHAVASPGGFPPSQGGPGAQAPAKPGTPSAKPPTSVSKPTSGQPQRGAATPRASATPRPTPVQKLSSSEVDSAASGATEDLDTLSPEQINAGNYPKGHLSFHGLPISIENNRGSKRGEKTEAGKKKWVRMPAPYGYIRGTIGADKSQVDVYIGPNPDSDRVFVIDQNRVSKKGKQKGFDEHKVMLGYDKKKDAVRDYEESHFDGQGHERLKAITEMTLDELKSWLRDGNTRKPAHKQDFGTVVKSDTISQSTGLLSYSYLPRKSVRRKRRKERARAGARWLELRA